jgi:predicted DNA-binding protein (MmcQ/YjbR family)
MDIEFLRDYCLNKQEVTEGTPFGPDTLVLKVCNKMFCLFSINDFKSVNLKCDPERAIELRADYIGIRPGYHMSKTHWNTIDFDSDVNEKLILELVDHSYELVVASLPKKDRMRFLSNDN